MGSVPIDAPTRIARATNHRTHLLASAAMVLPTCKRAVPTPIPLMGALPDCAGNSTNRLTLTQHSEEEEQQRERRDETRRCGLDHGCLYEGELLFARRKFFVCPKQNLAGNSMDVGYLYLFSAICPCTIMMLFSDEYRLHALMLTERTTQREIPTNKVDVLIIAHRALLWNKLPLSAPCDG